MFPLLLLLRRRLGGLAMVALATLPVVALGLLVPRVASVSPVDKLSWLTPQLAPLFALGLAGAGVVVARDRIRRLPWPWLAALAAVPVLAVVIGAGTVWTVRHYFWIDLAIAPALVMLLVAVSTGRPPALVRLLDTGPVKGLGRFSYSLYLVHLPIVVVVSRTLTGHDLVPRGLPLFLVTLAVAVPLSLGFARLFAAVFEIPFQRYRGWPYPSTRRSLGQYRRMTAELTVRLVGGRQ